MLKNNGIKYIVGDFWFDPAVQGPNIPKMKGLLILPQNYYRYDHPWKKDLDEFLKEVWCFKLKKEKDSRNL